MGTNNRFNSAFQKFDQRPLIYSYLAFGWYLLLNNGINASSVWLEYNRDPDGSLRWWEPWVWEYTSACSTFLLLPILVWLFRRLPLRFAGLATQLLWHFVASLVFCICHVALMVGLRKVIYNLQQLNYDFGPVLPEFFYEYRKDVWGYLFLLLLFQTAQFIYHRLKGDAMLIATESNKISDNQATSITTEKAAPEHFLVRKLDQEFLVKVTDIEWLEASGNYVNLYCQGRIYPLRATLANTVDRLQAQGFSRVHRSHAVNHQAIHSIRYDSSGDGEILLHSGNSLALSRRYKEAFKNRFQPPC